MPHSGIVIKTVVLLGRVALGAERPIVIKLSRVRSVALCVGRYVGASVCPLHCGKTADRIRMPFGIIGRTGPGMKQVVVFEDRSTGRGTFFGGGANFGRTIVTNGDFTAYVCDSAATRPSSQITLGKLVIIIMHTIYSTWCMAVPRPAAWWSSTLALDSTSSLAMLYEPVSQASNRAELS